MAVNINVHYTDKSSDPNKQPFTLVPGEVNSSETSLVLSGQGAANYSTNVNENFLHMLENFASATPPLHATVGQLWYNTGTERELRVLASIGVNGSGQRVDNWVPVGNNVAIGSGPPTSTSRLWYDMSDGSPLNHTLKTFNTVSGVWQQVTPISMVQQPTPPATAKTLWYNTSNPDATKHELHVWNVARGNWFPVISHDAGLLTGLVPNATLVAASIGGNAATATTAGFATSAALAGAAVGLQTGRVFSITGAATAAGVGFDGQQNVTLNVSALNASFLNAGTVPVARIGDAGPRAPGYYLSGNNVWTALPYIPDSYTKAESNSLLDARAWRDSITYVGMAGNDPNLPYMRRASDNGVYYLQPRLGYTPAPISNTLAGYGIVDAYTKAEVNSLIPAMPPGNTGVIGASGWTRLPNGLTFQWGQGPALGDDQSAIIGLHVAGYILGIHVTAIGAATNGIGPGFMSDTWTGSTFRVSNNYNSGPNRPFSWLAITAT